MSPSIRKIALTAHVTSSVGWLGAVGAFLALALAGLFSSHAQIARAAYVAMELVAWCVIVPLSLASLVTGVIQSLGTNWGLFRHYWVAKFGITVLASVLLLVHMQIANRMATVATDPTLALADFRGMRVQLVADAAAAVVVLLIATVLSIYKPQGLTPFGRKQEESGASGGVLVAGDARWRLVIGAVVLALIAFALFKHLSSGGLSHHH